MRAQRARTVGRRPTAHNALALCLSARLLRGTAINNATEATARTTQHGAPRTLITHNTPCTRRDGRDDQGPHMRHVVAVCATTLSWRLSCLTLGTIRSGVATLWASRFRQQPAQPVSEPVVDPVPEQIRLARRASGTTREPQRHTNKKQQRTQFQSTRTDPKSLAEHIGKQHYKGRRSDDTRAHNQPTPMPLKERNLVAQVHLPNPACCTHTSPPGLPQRVVLTLLQRQLCRRPSPQLHSTATMHQPLR